MPELSDWTLSLHGASTWAMVGLIWFVQIVHYPLILGRFAAELGDRSRALQAEHMRRTTLVVGPLMAIEAVSAAILLLLAPSLLTFAGIALLAVCWGSTALVQVPCHQRLESGFDPAAARRLVRSNWLRTSAWTGRGAVATLCWNPDLLG